MKIEGRFSTGDVVYLNSDDGIRMTVVKVNYVHGLCDLIYLDKKGKAHTITNLPFDCITPMIEKF